MHGTLGSLESLKGVPLQLALDNTGLSVAACDADGMLTLFSPSLQELFGMDFEPITERDFVARFQLLRADGVTSLPDEEVPLARARRGEFVRDAVIATRRDDGTTAYLRCNAVPLRDDGGADAGAIALIQDVTAETVAAQQAEALRARLVQTINHEFRTPLAALLGHVELVKDHRDDLDPELASWLAAIDRAGWRLRDLVCQVAQLVAVDEADCPVDRRPRTRGTDGG